MKTQLLDDEVLEAMNLQRRYNIFNNNMMFLFNDEDKAFAEELQTICVEKEEAIGGVPGHNSANIYDWMPWAGKHGLIARSNEYPHRDDLKVGLKAELIRQWTMDIFNPQFSLAAGASVLAINPIAHHHKERAGLKKDLVHLLDGTKIGCICITEPTRGSDAVNMLVKAEKSGDDILINGVKCYNTNSPVADIAVVYAVYNTDDPRGTMIQGVSHKEWDTGFKAERIGIPSVPQIQIGKTIFEDSRIPADYITGDNGEGMAILFEGLVPERIGIAALNLGQCWGAFTLAAIYSTIRKQFGQKIILHQSVGMSVLAKYHSRLMVTTIGLLKLAETYDEKKEELAGIPATMNPLVAFASQFKEYTSVLYHELAYELMHAMGGTGVTDQTLMPHYQGVSEIAEVVGGTRNVQFLIGSRTINTMVKMS